MDQGVNVNKCTQLSPDRSLQYSQGELPNWQLDRQFFDPKSFEFNKGSRRVRWLPSCWHFFHALPKACEPRSKAVTVKLNISRQSLNPCF